MPRDGTRAKVVCVHDECLITFLESNPVSVATLETLARGNHSCPANRWETSDAILTEPMRRFDAIRNRPLDRRPVIGVNCDIVQQGDDDYSFIPNTYLESLHNAGAAMVAIPPYFAVPIDAIDGVVMIGGRDLDPRDDGYQLHPSHRLMHPLRNGFDRRLVAMCAKHKIPLLAIGVGMQTLNVVQGGSLSYHIADDFHKALPHIRLEDKEHGHAIDCRDGSMCKEIYAEAPDAFVRSQHHQCVDDVANGFVATAWSRDGIIEAIESVTDWTAIGVQWHPEFTTATKIDRLLFEYFVALTSVPQKA